MELEEKQYKKIKKNNNEDLLKATVGEFGWWQLKISLLMALLKFPIAWFQLGIVFLAPPTNFWCKPPELYANLTVNEWLEMARPIGKEYLKQERLNSGFCEMRNQLNSNLTISCTSGYDYNRTIFHSSIVTEWNLVCGRQHLIDTSQIILMLGVLIGNIVFGVMADKRGRKPVLIFCIAFQSIFAMLAAWSPWLWGFVLCRFLMAIFNGGTVVTSFVMCMEVVGGKWRTIVPILYQIPFGFGNTIMAGLAFYLRDWRHLQCALAFLSSLFVTYFWCIPESPRWLLAVGKKDEAMKILQKAAITNGRSVEAVEIALTDLSNVNEERNKTKFSSLFSTPILKTRSSLLCLNWTIVGITFYAFSQYLGHVSHDIYFTVACGGLIALPGTFFCVYIVGICGRRWTVATAHFLTAACFFFILVVPLGVFVHDWPRVGIAALGIVGMSISMPALYLFTGELFPTVLRNAGVGASVMFARIGSMIAPLIIALQDVAPYLPLTILGGAAIIEGILVLLLPETKGIPLPETIDDLEMSQCKTNKISFQEQGSYVTIPKDDDLS